MRSLGPGDARPSRVDSATTPPSWRCQGRQWWGSPTQSTAYQREAAERLLLPYPLLSDADLLLTSALRLPTFTARLRAEHDGGGVRTLLERLTLVVCHGTIERVFHPVRAPEVHADEVLAWIWADRPGDAP
jgi:peroxiredoxin